MIGENDGFTREAMGGVMQDRDSFYHRAIRTKLGDAMRAQLENADGKEPKGLDLDDPEQRRRFVEGKAAQR
jgi:hypothetical protein